jgi:UDP-N-acetylglucosamine acyltransferase
MATVHPTTIIEGSVDLADDVAVGPHCVLTGSITVGPGTKLLGNVYLNGPLHMGQDNVVYPFTCLGFAGQDVSWDPQRAGAGVTIGHRNVFREQVTIHRATSERAPTTVGDGNYFMTTSHAGHDCRIGDDCVLVNAATTGGHVQLENKVILGGGAMVHQHCRIGRGAMMGGHTGASLDVPPFFMVTGVNTCGSVNLVGARRSGMSREEIDTVRWVYRTLYREGLSLTSAVEVLRSRRDQPMVEEYIRFLEGCKRGICHGVPRRIREEATEP